MAPSLIAPAQRLYRCARGLNPLVLTSWEYIRRGERGRWDDTEDEYRVLYLSDTPIGAFVEILQDLRPNVAAQTLLDEVVGDDEPFAPVQMVRERLQSRYFATLVPANPEEQVVDIGHGATRSFIEEHLNVPRVKLGAFADVDRVLPRATSRLMYDHGHRGVRALSAEHDGSHTIAIFETHSVSGELRLGLIVLGSDLALMFPDEVTEAAAYLGLSLGTSDATRVKGTGVVEPGT